MPTFIGILITACALVALADIVRHARNARSTPGKPFEHGGS